MDNKTSLFEPVLLLRLHLKEQCHRCACATFWIRKLKSLGGIFQVWRATLEMMSTVESGILYTRR